MRFRLRTLLIVLALAPPVLAVGVELNRRYREWQYEQVRINPPVTGMRFDLPLYNVP
jgi:hypothetical protein